MTLHKATIKKVGETWVAEYDSDTIPAIKEKSTLKHPEIKANIGLRLEPREVIYPSDKYTLEQVVESTQSRLASGECEMCEREQEVVAVFVSGLYEVKEQMMQQRREKAVAQSPSLAEQENKPMRPILPRPTILNWDEVQKELGG